jgi:hypothetical protein
MKSNPQVTMNHHPLPRPAPTKTAQIQPLSTKNPGDPMIRVDRDPIIRVDRILFLRSTYSDSSDSDSSSSCSTTTRGRRRFRKRPSRIPSPVDRVNLTSCRHIESGVMEVMISGRRSTNAAAVQQDDDSSISSLSSYYETGSESESEDEEICLRNKSMHSQNSSLANSEESRVVVVFSHTS